MRYQAYLRERYRALLAYVGVLLVLIGGLFLAPLLTLIFYPEESFEAIGFFLAGVPLIVCGGLLWGKLVPPDHISLTFEEGAVVVVIVWWVATLFGAFPFVISNHLSFTQAIFESTSAWTTTGLSVIDVTETTHIILFYRSFLQMVGGAGFAIIMLSAITGPVGASLSVAEGRGDQLAPHVRRSAGIVLSIYAGYIIFGVLALRLIGMNLFDAINHAFTAVSTGGFSTRPESIGYWDDPLIEGVVILLMLMGTMNFLTAYTLFQRKYRPVLKNGEVRLIGFFFIASTLALLGMVTLDQYTTFGKSLRVAVFEAVSALSTTGFATVGYQPWIEFGWIIIIGLMVVGGGSGSTSGGIKQYRIYVLYKALSWEIRRAFMPRHAVNEPAIWQGEKQGFLSDREARQVALFVFLYLAVLFLGGAAIAAHGYSVGESFFEFSSALGTVGLSLGITGPDAPDSLLWTQTFGMFLGRLEFLAVIIGFTKLAIDVRRLVSHPPSTQIQDSSR